MRTKTLLLSAVALAAGLVSSWGQSSNVYSVNVVGYYNVSVPAGGYAFLANQLTNAGNNVSLALTNGPRSDVNGVQNTVLFRWTGGGYSTYQFFTGSDADNYFLIGPGSPDGWYDAAGTLTSTTLDQGAGNFLYNPSPVAITNTLLGEVVQRTNNIPIVTGFNALSLVPPVSTNIDSLLGNFPGTSDVNGINNDIYYFFTGGGYSTLQYFTGPDADNYFLIGPGSPSGWYDAGGTYQSLNPAFIPKVGQAFFIRHFTAPTNWVYSFTVQ
jgi:hypothetical protein